MKQQSHSQSVTSVRYSPDAIHLATGAEDGLVKVWSCRSSSCIVTFNEHTCSVSAVCWTPSGKAILSASYDGTVRAHDLVRYRNFRTLLCPEQTQLSCLAVDGGGDLVMAGSHDLFNIFVWSLDNGRLLDVLSGHTAVLASISAHGNSLASVSWDKSLRVWNVAEGSAPEIVTLVDEALAVAYSPCGLIIAVLTLDSTISLFDGTACSSQLGTIDTKLDVDPARSATDLITKANSGKSK
ncbi:hypothetical protein AB6A40_008150 [Gnathostoma spinigerum]|uniref:Uncharacterized protein n=1 Tax=Gnathostoma spinigerum TaxID=75299 RepID=A0ABD6ENQ2_9BILA